MDLGGWDLVFAIDIAQINVAFSTQRAKLIQSFDFTTPVSAKGNFGDWKIVEGGAGNLLNLSIAIENGTLNAASGPIPLDGAVLTIQVRLALLSAANGQTLGLDLDTITFQNFVNPKGMGEITAQMMGDAFCADLSKHATEVSFVLASISPLAAGAPAWLAPQALSFAYAVPAGGQPVLAIFAVTTQRDITQLSLKVDPSLIGPDGAGLGIAPRLFMTNVFAPAVSGALGFSVNQVAMSTDSQLVNTAELGLNSVSEAGENYYPKLSTFSATLIDDHIDMVTNGNCDLGMNISMSFSGNSSVGLAMGTPGNLNFSTRSSNFDHDVDIPWYDHLLDIAGGVAEIILQVTVSAISSELSTGISHVAGASALVSVAPSIVDWAGGGGFTADAAGLSDGFWLHGKPTASRSSIIAGKLGEK
jgi:hypothetical protein